ncbi:molybdenum ABC transporter ATP-binding protein [Sunxiuqinia sp. A32]|uniref:molybdenum ABC transporter ATP-binding protein n=1 Tax=Sunxiuqinia sp. A32 TaxID=3461496 RepID=UPI0040463C40
MNDSVYIDIKYTRGEFMLQAKTFIPNGIVGLFGPSGHGKTTLLKLLAGIETPDQGQIIIKGHEVYNRSCKINIPTRKRNIGMVFQEGRLFPHMTVRKNLLYGYQPTSSIQFDEVVDLLEIRSLLDKKPQQCSGGEKQRVAIGRMLLNSPAILMLDEPFSALDQRLRRNIIPYLIKIHEKFDLPILVVSHDLDDLLMLTDQLMLVENGRIIGMGLYNDLLFDSFANRLLHSEELLNAVRLRAHSIDYQSGMTAFYYYSNYPGNYLLIDSDHEFYPDDQMIMGISPKNISLSLEKVGHISARNQLEGKIVSIHEQGRKAFCMVDVGFLLLVEITRQSLINMGLVQGMKVYCMFKSSSPKILFVGK